ncbi:MAG: hypothetical protein WD382_07095 [Halofilum sp. (in: g-proteobacteria)]
MRTFIALAFLAGVAFWAGYQTPKETLPGRVLRYALFLASGIFGALLVSAVLQALLGLD